MKQGKKMRRLIYIVTIILLTSTLTFAKKKGKTASVDELPFYGVGLTNINTGTGHGPGYAVSGSIMKGRKSIEAGIIYSERESKLSGGDFKYQVYIGNIDRIHNNNTIFRPYFQYNIVYQRGLSTSPDVVQLGEQTVIIEDTEPGEIATIGHYLGYGNKVKIMGNAYIESSVGIGVYQGSLDKVNGPHTLGIHKENHGFTYSLKLGFGYTFK